MIQAPRKSNGIELSYQQHDESALEIARLHAQLRQVREWADRGEWRESGSDGLYAILREAREEEPPASEPPRSEIRELTRTR